ncbi:MAG: NYN domain-containing protein, partial [Spirochaetales bacterium]|nr:NYN domain-containing protein [Spirochaetales bacterium]
MNDSDKIAILIDADNTQLQKLDAIMTEVSTHGRIVVKRAYGNWKKRNLNKWENELKRLGIKAEQQFDYVSGKNATDMALVIDAMDLLSSNAFDSFV